MNMIDAMADECDWITNISPMTLINLVADIIENEPNITNKQQLFAVRPHHLIRIYEYNMNLKETIVITLYAIVVLGLMGTILKYLSQNNKL